MTAVVTVEKQKLDNPPLDIHYLGDRVLRQPAKRIAKVDDAIRKLAKEMLQTMYSSNGIGLAAPQVGIHKQLVVIDCDPEDPESQPLILVNPQITSYGKEKCNFEEGCLSIPGIHLEVSRPEKVEVTFRDAWGKPQKIKAFGLLARVIQHELDHLNGVLFVDRVENQLALADQFKDSKFSVQAIHPVRG